TSPAAAALRDVLTTLARRNPAIPVIVYPVPVQGEGAAARIAAMLASANARDECDVLLLVRGGGSIEDLWSFNEENVARALRASRGAVASASRFRCFPADSSLQRAPRAVPGDACERRPNGRARARLQHHS